MECGLLRGRRERRLIQVANFWSYYLLYIYYLICERKAYTSARSIDIILSTYYLQHPSLALTIFLSLSHTHLFIYSLVSVSTMYTLARVASIFPLVFITASYASWSTPCQGFRVLHDPRFDISIFPSG